MDYKNFVNNFTKQLINLQEIIEDDVKGASLKEITNLEKKYNVKLPEIYKEFLHKLGHCPSGFGDDLFFPPLYNMQDIANEILERDNSELFPLKDKFVFYRHGEEFLYFPTNEGDNPPVYGYLTEIEKEGWVENSKEHFEDRFGITAAKKIFKFYYIKNGDKYFNSFSDYLINELDVILLKLIDSTYRIEYKKIINSFKEI